MRNRLQILNTLEWENCHEYQQLPSLGAIVLLAGCGPQVGVVQPYPANILVQQRPHRLSAAYPRDSVVYPRDSVVYTGDSVAYPRDSRVVVLNDPRVPSRRPVEVLDLKYDPRSEMTVRDVVLGKRFVKPADGHTGVVVTLQPGGDYIDALVGTTQFLTDHGMDIGIADPLMVTGAVVRLENRPVLLAREVVSRGQTLRLREEDGRPLWSSNYNLAGR